MYAKVNSLGLLGLNAFPVDVEIETSKGTPSFDIIGLADTVIRESRERIRAALRSSYINFPLMRIIVNLAPADTKKTGSVHDLAIFTAMLSVMGHITADISKSAFIGEIALNGDLRGISGVLPMVLLAKKEGFTDVFVPEINSYEASVVDGIRVYAVKNTAELIKHFDGSRPIMPCKPYDLQSGRVPEDIDYAEVKGQQSAKKALEVAAAGGHNVLMIGAPGSGKSMMAKRIVTILPEMTFDESIETTNIHSICGVLDPDTPLVTRRPFRSPHHTISSVGLAGGGSIPHPGEISLAHNGVLFLDELAEFPRTTLEILRQPLEDKKITISRESGTITYPCSFMLIAAMNPCPCGYYGNKTHECRCSPNQIKNYLSRISGPMLDRFDIHCRINPVEYNEIASNAKEESSEAVRERVCRAREIQNERYKGTGITCNAGITDGLIGEVCPLTDDAEKMIKSAFDRLGLSARGYNRLLKLSRTFADIEGRDTIDKTDVANAIQYRTLDRQFWGR
jgi:magnesium chelatase family protein